MDISSKAEGATGLLSNFTGFYFIFDGVVCMSMEGLVQSFKTAGRSLQREVCLKVGKEAKKWGQEFGVDWKITKKLYWQGVEYDRHSQEYQDLLDRAYSALANNRRFREILLSTGEEVLTHSIGESDPNLTVLTEHEFCSRLEKLRKGLRSKLTAKV